MPAATVKTLAYADEVAILGSTAGAATAATGAAGDDTDAARSDHVHPIGTGSVDGATIKLTAGVLSFERTPVAAPGPTELVKGMLYMEGTALKAVTVSYSA
jgi:hypothetical protein